MATELTKKWNEEFACSKYSAVKIGFKYARIGSTKKVRVYIGWQIDNPNYFDGYATKESEAKIGSSTVFSGNYRWYGYSKTDKGVKTLYTPIQDVDHILQKYEGKETNYYRKFYTYYNSDGTKEYSFNDLEKGKQYYLYGNEWHPFGYNDYDFTEYGDHINGSKKTTLNYSFYSVYHQPTAKTGQIIIPAGAIPKEAWYTACTAPTSISVSAASVKTGQEVIVNWSGASAGTGVSIDGYRIYYKYANTKTDPTSDDLFIPPTGVFTGTSCTYTVPSGNEGKYCTLKAVAVASNTSFNSALSTASAYNQVVSSKTSCLPPKSVTISPSVVAPGGTVTIEWSGAAGGADNSITGYSIKLNGNTKILNTEQSYGKITFNNLTTIGSSYYAEVRTQGSAGSSYYSAYTTSSNSVTVNNYETTDVSFLKGTYDGVLPDASTSNLVKSFTFSSVTNTGGLKNYELYLRSSTVSAEAVESASPICLDDNIAIGKSFLCSNISTLAIRGTWFQLGVKAIVSESQIEDSICWEEPISYIPKKISDLSKVSFGSSDEFRDGTKLNKDITIDWKNPVVDSGQTVLKNCIIYIKSANDSDKILSAEWQICSNKGYVDSGGEYSEKIGVENYRGKTIKFKITITDDYGNITESESNVFSVINLPTLNNANLTTSSLDFEPYSTISDFYLTLSVKGSAGTNSYTYKYSYYCPSKEATINLGTEKSITTSDFEHKVSGNDFKTLLLSTTAMQKSSGYYNGTYTDGYFRITLEDSFGNITNYITTNKDSIITVDYCAKPVIESWSQKIVYNQSATTYSDYFTNISDNTKHVIAGEKAVITIKASDQNGIGQDKDQITYVLEYAYGTNSYSLTNWQVATSIEQSNQSSQELVFIFPQVSSDTWFSFRCKVIDSTNKSSDYKNLYSVLNKTILPSSAILKDPTELKQTTITWENPTIEWAIYSSRACPSTYYSKTPTITVEGSPDGQNFTEIKSFTIPTTSCEVGLQSSNYYYRLKHEYKTGLYSAPTTNSTISAYSNTIIIYAENQPLISYRKNYLGINQATPSTTAVIDIQKIGSTRNKIHMGSSDIQLNTKNSSMINFIIDCGTY